MAAVALQPSQPLQGGQRSEASLLADLHRLALVRREQQPAATAAKVSKEITPPLPAEHVSSEDHVQVDEALNNTLDEADPTPNPDPVASLPTGMPDQDIAHNQDFVASRVGYSNLTQPGTAGAEAAFPLHLRAQEGEDMAIKYDTSGVTGPPGYDGPLGMRGPPGIPGEDGPGGADGMLHMGPQGPPGERGILGEPGAIGPRGPPGPPGKRGPPSDGEKHGQELVFLAQDLLRKVDAVAQSHDEASTFLLAQIRMLEKQLGLDVDELAWAESAMNALKGKETELAHNVNDSQQLLATTGYQVKDARDQQNKQKEELQEAEEDNRDLNWPRPAHRNAASRRFGAPSVASWPLAAAVTIAVAAMASGIVT